MKIESYATGFPNIQSAERVELLFFERGSNIGLSVARVIRHSVLSTRSDSTTADHRKIVPRYLIPYQLLIRNSSIN
jgi:hypothetical protein